MHDFFLRNLKNQTVIDFWATWCQPCIRSLPKLVELSVMAVPTLLIVNHENQIVYMHEGFNAGDEEEIRNEIAGSLSKQN